MKEIYLTDNQFKALINLTDFSAPADDGEHQMFSGNTPEEEIWLKSACKRIIDQLK